MFGYRKRIGYITPTVMEVVPYEFYRFAPEGVGLCGVTCAIEALTAGEFDKGLSLVVSAAAYLGSRKVDFIVHGGSPLVASRGAGYEDELVGEIEAASGGVPATTSVSAMRQALEALGARTIAIASPYPQSQHDSVASVLEGQGFSVVPTTSADIAFKAMQDVSPEAIASHCLDVLAVAGPVDALAIPCPQWQAAQAVPAIEAEADIPAVAATHANFFTAFSALGIGDSLVGHGRLMTLLAAGRRPHASP